MRVVYTLYLQHTGCKDHILQLHVWQAINASASFPLAERSYAGDPNNLAYNRGINARNIQLVNDQIGQAKSACFGGVRRVGHNAVRSGGHRIAVLRRQNGVGPNVYRNVHVHQPWQTFQRNSELAPPIQRSNIRED